MPHSPDENLKYWLALLRCPGAGPATFARLIEKFNQPRQVFDSPACLLQAIGLHDRVVIAIAHPDWAGVETDLEWRQRQNNHYIITWQDDAYPPLLRHIASAPPVLFIVGNPAVLHDMQIAMVGSRNPSADGKQTALEFARHLSAAGLVITSGLAIGIDGICHQGALDAGGATIAVTGTGLDRLYPARNHELAHAMVEHGAIISEFPLGTEAKPQNFPRRNRIISGLSSGTLVVEAATRSGSLITARHAVEQGREVFAIPGSIHNPLARGCHQLIQQGAKLVETAEDIISELRPLQAPPWERQVINKQKENDITDEPEYEHLLGEMGYAPVAVNDIVQRTGLTAEQVSSMMLILELRGSVASSPGGCYIRVK